MSQLIHSATTTLSSSVYAIIVTFNGNWHKVAELVCRLKRDGIDYIIVDNGSENFDGSASLNVLFLGENLGIGSAQNLGIEYCQKHGASIIIFFDQDSEIKAGFIEALIHPILAGRTKIAAPVFYDIKNGFAYPIVSIDKSGLRTKHYIEQMQGELRTNVVISSGTAVDVDVFMVVGLMNSNLFIDYVDTEWCLRCAEAGYSVLIDPDVKMDHSIGDKSLKLWRYRIPVHSPVRRYYRIRNSILLTRMLHVPKLMAFREIVFSILHQMILIVMERRERWKYFKYMCIGIGHGIVNKSGKL
jgi:rhamnosyltransferase